MFGLGPESIAAMSGAVLYISIFALPFVQEDAAVIGAATASLAGAAPIEFILPAILTGLVASDAWKYWMGRLARRHDWAHRFAEKPGVSIAGDLIRKEFMQTMLTARFVPGTRIPTYVAAGFFKADYPRYVLTLVFTAALYVGIVFVLFHSIGAVAGEKAKIWLPVGAIAILIVYVCVRWLNHVNRHEGPMTPMSTDFDHPLPEIDDSAFEEENRTEKQAGE
ncbi:MAG: hypothetical protein AAGD92_04420 [Pseudomonadota bacterium]